MNLLKLITIAIVMVTSLATSEVVKYTNIGMVTVESPGYPGNYGADIFENWLFTQEFGSGIRFRFEELFLEKSGTRWYVVCLLFIKFTIIILIEFIVIYFLFTKFIKLIKTIVFIKI